MLLFLLLVSGAIVINLVAQKATELSSPNALLQPSPSEMEKDLAIASKLMTSKRSADAVGITTQVLKKLEKDEKFNTPFGLKVRLVHGSALIHVDTSSTSLDFLLQLKDDSKTNKQWDIFAETCRVIASVLEYAGRKEQSLENLREAQTVIHQYQLDSIYPHFAVRISSWHRIFGDKDSSIFYANEAIRTAPKFGKVFEEAEGHLLLGGNYAKTDYKTAISHYQAAAQLYRKIGELTSYCGMQISMASLKLAHGEPAEAMANLDSAILYAPPTKGNNIEAYHTARTFILKGNAFQQLGQLDSAIFYLNKGHSMELQNLKTLDQAKVVEIDNIYNVKKKTEELEAKNLEIQTGKGRRNWLVALVSLVLLFLGALLFYYLKLRNANQKIQEQTDQLKNLDVAKSRFFANISHELRTPLTLVLGPISTLLNENQLSEKQIKLLQMASHSGKQLNHLVNEILDLRKLEMGKMELNLQTTPLATFFIRHFVQFESLAQRKEIEFSFETTIDKHVEAKIDWEKCRQLLYNLLSNAFKFTPAGGKIQVKLGLLDLRGADSQFTNSPIHQFLLSISDTGPGIHPDDLPHVFDRFFQTSQPDKPAEGGTGIGLALCQEYVKLFGGKIEVKNQLGKGSTFQVEFPVEVVITEPQLQIQEDLTVQLASDFEEVAERPYLPQVTGAADPAIVDPAKPTILVVEDNPELQDYICLILKDKYNVVTADNGLVALQWLMGDLGPDCQLPTANCQLVLSDLMMPIMDGYQLLEKLKSDDATWHIPVIMLTARAEAQDKLKALRIGVDDYLTKPFDEEELLVRIENLLKNLIARRKEIPAMVESESPDTLVISEPDRVWLEAYEAHVQQNLSSDILSVTFLAQEFAMSESSLLRQLKRLTGLSPVQYLQEMRLDQARHLLENRTYNSIAKVAAEVGYNDPRFFSRSFKKRFGKSPTELLSD